MGKNKLGNWTDAIYSEEFSEEEDSKIADYLLNTSYGAISKFCSKKKKASSAKKGKICWQ